ncbi:MAG: pteridine reductase [Gammaproteobacteria bacterium]|nr:pteridine reductase [Gammaproteobacteria bacterium]
MSDRTAIVTGGATRIGRAISTALHEAGYRVWVHYRSSKDAARELTRALNRSRAQSAELCTGDLAVFDDVERLAEQLLQAIPRLDLLVNNASTFYRTRLGEVTRAQWDEVMGVNLGGPFFLTQGLLPSLERAKGSVVNVTDIHAERPLGGYPIYSMAKAGLAMMTRALARELAPGVRVNAVAPGAILWPVGEEPSESVQQRILERIPMGRFGEPQDIARAVLYLAEAQYVTGQSLSVDGGRSIKS